MNNMNFLKTGAITLALCAAVVTSCKQDKDVTGVRLTKTTLTLVVDANETLRAIVAPASAANRAVAWSSSDNAVATVADGVVTAVSVGTATITVTTKDGGKTAACAVTVVAHALTVDKTTIVATIVAGTYTVAVTSNVAWTAASDAAWCTVTPASGSGNDTVTVTVNGNPGATARNATVTIAGGTLSQQVAVTQATIDIDMVFVAGGTFTMGCTGEQGSDCESNENPAHNVTLSDFHIGKYEVTQVQWIAVMGSNPSYFTGDNLPVGYVSWNDVQAFITALNTATGKNYRLPTEAEWEYAARGGAQSGGYKYSGSNTVDDVAWYGGSIAGSAHAVGTKAPNELGIYDMSGNVYECCSDWYGDYPSEAQTNPTGPSTGSSRMIRGGGWNYYASNCRVAFRINSAPSISYSILGFRLARSSN
ncbi:MAG: SUMF1/EgtB/PvdO family nonheme iron enzyme [Prevotellaceae bacterium]|nr:SUMF1/EgtB/PvdO family nonheme iron enzyme [Prevotellaceae bacterium]